MNQKAIDNLLETLKQKGIFSEYLPENFNLSGSKNLYDCEVCTYNSKHVACYDRIEPYSYYMSRYGKPGDRRMISIPELSSYIALIDFLNKNRVILKDIIQFSSEDSNSFSRIADDNLIIVDSNDIYNEMNFFDDDSIRVVEEKKYSQFVENMLYKLHVTRGAAGILHIDISEFYKSIYTHTIPAIKYGMEGARECFLSKTKPHEYYIYNKFDAKIRNMNGARTNGLLVGPYISRVVSEALLAKVDSELEDVGLIFTRYADDYEFAIYHDDDLEDIKSKLFTVFDKYCFRINNEKTLYEKYPFYIFNNYERIINRMVGKDGKIDTVDIVELFNKFLTMEKNGEKGALRYLLKAYNSKYDVHDKKLYADYLLNALCNDEKALGLACKIIIREYKDKKIELDEDFYDVILEKLKYEIKKKHDLEIVWLTYLLKYTEFPMTEQILDDIFKSNCDLAIIIALEEWNDLIDSEKIDSCWNNATSWILLYQITLHDNRKKEDFFQKVNIENSKKLYDKLLDEKFSFYKTGFYD